MKCARRFFAALCILGLLSTGCPLLAAATQTVKIGVVGPQAGSLAVFGAPVIAAVELVVREVNAKGGLLGRRVDLVIEDDDCRPETAITIAHNFVALDLAGVIGHICNDATRAALEIYDQSSLIIISPTSNALELTHDGKHPLFFRTIVPADAEARKVAAFILEKRNLKAIAIQYIEEDYFAAQAESTKRRLEAAAGAKLVSLDPYIPGKMDFGMPERKLKSEDSGGIVFWGPWEAASAFLDLLRKRGISTTVVVAGVTDRDRLLGLGTFTAGPLFFSVPRSPLDIPLASAARQSYLELTGKEPSSFFYNAYAAATVLLQSIAQAGDPKDHEAIAQQLHNLVSIRPSGKSGLNA